LPLIDPQNEHQMTLYVVKDFIHDFGQPAVKLHVRFLRWDQVIEQYDYMMSIHLAHMQKISAVQKTLQTSH